MYRFPLPPGTRIAVPRMHPSTPRDLRVQVCELVLRGHFGLAVTIADEAELARRRAGDPGATLLQLDGLMRETPHRNARAGRAA